MGLASAFAIVTGMVALVRDAVMLSTGRSRAVHPFWERACCVGGFVALLGGVLVVVQGRYSGGSAVMMFAYGASALGLATILVFPTRWRLMSEGLGVVALGVFSLLAPILFLIPFVLGITALRHSDPRLIEASRIAPE